MGNGYNHRVHKQSLHLHLKYTFLPMLCSRPSIKDVSTPGGQSTSFSNDPLSPKISCMGQVKRNNKIVGFPSSTNNKLAITSKNNHVVRYSKLKKMFSGNSLSATTPSTTNTAATTCRRREVAVDGGSRAKIDESKVASVLISIDEMDPPLPVIKKVRKPAVEEEQNNLWKRRSGGTTLRNLQLQQIQPNRYSVQPSTV